MNAAKNVVKLTQKTNACEQCHARELCMTSLFTSKELQTFDDVVGHRAPMRKGERLFLAGDDAKALYVLHSGSVKSYVESTDGDNQITGFHLPGDVIGLNGVDHKVHGETVESLETSSVCELRFSDYEEICKKIPSLQKQLLRYVLKELSHEQTLLLVLGKLTAERRIAYFLLDLSERMNERGLSGSRLNLTMTRHDIANYLGLAVETVSRILTRLQKAKILDVERRSIVIKDFDYLELILSNQSGDLASL